MVSRWLRLDGWGNEVRIGMEFYIHYTYNCSFYLSLTLYSLKNVWALKGSVSKCLALCSQFINIKSLWCTHKNIFRTKTIKSNTYWQPSAWKIYAAMSNWYMLRQIFSFFTTCEQVSLSFKTLLQTNYGPTNYLPG